MIEKSKRFVELPPDCLEKPAIPASNIFPLISSVPIALAIDAGFAPFEPGLPPKILTLVSINLLMPSPTSVSNFLTNALSTKFFATGISNPPTVFSDRPPSRPVRFL